MLYIAETTEGHKDDGFAPLSLAEEVFKEINVCPPNPFPQNDPARAMHPDNPPPACLRLKATMWKAVAKGFREGGTG